MSEHTPGPWVRDYPDISLGRDIVNHETQTSICYVYRAHGAEEANARLITASPDLLEACEAALTYLQGITDDHWLKQKLRAAIVRARGTVTEAPVDGERSAG